MPTCWGRAVHDLIIKLNQLSVRLKENHWLGKTVPRVSLGIFFILFIIIYIAIIWEIIYVKGFVNLS